MLDYTGADAVMIGRGALGRPWIFNALNEVLNQYANTASSGQKTTSQPVSLRVQRDTIISHLNELHRLYGKERGVRVGRKHLTWYCKYLNGAEEFRNQIVRIDDAATQLQLTTEFLEQLHGSEGGAEESTLHVDTMFSGKEYFQKETSGFDQENCS